MRYQFLKRWKGGAFRYKFCVFELAHTGWFADGVHHWYFRSQFAKHDDIIVTELMRSTITNVLKSKQTRQ